MFRWSGTGGAFRAAKKKDKRKPASRAEIGSLAGWLFLFALTSLGMLNLLLRLYADIQTSPLMWGAVVFAWVMLAVRIRSHVAELRANGKTI